MDAATWSPPGWLSAVALGYLVVASLAGLLFFFVLVPLALLGSAVGAWVPGRTLRGLLWLGLAVCVLVAVGGVAFDHPEDGTGGGTEFLALFGLYGLAAAVCVRWLRERS